METTDEKPRIRAWMFGTGLLLVLVGFAFLLLPMFATAIAGIAAGALLLVSGVAQVIDGVGQHGRGKGWAIALGVIAGIAGVLLLADPLAGMVGLTVLLASYLLVGGIFRIVLAARWSPAPGWGWALFNGIVTLLLGVFVLSGWPETGLWTIGVFLGVDALLAGFSRVARALGAPERADRMLPS